MSRLRRASASSAGGGSEWLQSDEAIKAELMATHCMFDGMEGSDLKRFDGAEVNPTSAWPAEGPQYIEAMASGACASQASTFTFRFSNCPDQSGREEVGTATIQEKSDAHYWNSNSDIVAAQIDNRGDQAKIEVRVGPNARAGI